MDPFTISLIVAAGVQLVGGVVSNLMEQGREADADQIMKAAYDKYGGTREFPTLEKFQEQILSPTALAKIKPDAASEKAQYETLDQLKGYTDGQLNAQDQANLSRAQMGAGQMARNARESALRQMRNRGVSASGSELAMSQRGAQDASNALLQSGMDANAMAAQRAYQALMDRGGFASRLRSQKYGEEANAAQAQDAIDRYNAAARERGTMQRNQDALMRYQADLAERDFQMGYARDRAGAKRNNDSAQRLVGGAADTFGKGLATYGAWQARQRNPRDEPDDYVSGGSGGYRGWGDY